MKIRLGALPAAAAGTAFLVAAGFVSLPLRWQSNTAQAIELFGGNDDDSAQAEPFWREGSGHEPIVPHGVPASFADLAEEVSHGVVNIQTKRTVTGAAMPRSFEEFFFGQPFQRPGREHEVPSLGSGFVISPDGYIVTNNHVVEDVDEITVAFEDGHEVPAVVVGVDPKTDIALIRVQSDEELPALPLGNSDGVRPGEWVVAVGNPFGLEHTVTAGIVSAKHRVIGEHPYDDYIQTDAAINPGNSGGPLINLRGEVIGINTAIKPAANTIGFAVPINMAKDVLPQLRATGHVTRGWLGVVIQKVTPELAGHFNVAEPQGALVSRVMPGGPADEAGLKRGDVIVEFDGKKVDEMNDLPRMVASTPVDKKVKIVVVRDGDRTTLGARVGKMEEPQETQLASARGSSSSENYGLRVQQLTPELAARLGLDDEKGVLITGVEPGSTASDAGLRREDVILEVDKQPVADVSDLESRLESAEKDGALLLIRRRDATLFVPLKPPAG
jgi:serine protease Do